MWIDKRAINLKRQQKLESFKNSLLGISLLFDLAPAYLWFAIFSIQPHKEERFMFVMFSAFAFNASVGVHLFLSVIERVLLYTKSFRVRTLSLMC